jgi:hypothetical protein
LLHWTLKAGKNDISFSRTAREDHYAWTLQNQDH